jgi:hypothetical protein
MVRCFTTRAPVEGEPAPLVLAVGLLSGLAGAAATAIIACLAWAAFASA